MRKFSFLFAFLLSMMGATQAWASYSITGIGIFNSSDWSYDKNRWSEYDPGMYDNYTSNPTTTTDIISPKMSPAKLGQKITVSGYRGGYYVSQLKFYVSFDEKQTWKLVGDKGQELHNTDYPTIGTFDSDEFVAFGDYYVKIVVLGIYLTKFEIADIELSPKTVYLAVNDNWKTDNARFALYTKNGVTNVETWVDFQAVENEYDIYSASVPVGTTLIIPCRMNPASTENNWDNKWNQTQDITTINDNDLYTISGWDYASTGTYTPSTYSMTTNLSELAFGEILQETQKSFTLTNAGTGILKDINVSCNNPAFTITGIPETLTAHASATITVTMGTETIGEQTGVITISSTYADPITMNVSGSYVVNPIMEVNATRFDFGMIDTDASKTFTIINTGNATLTGIDVISSNTAFTIENAPSSIEAGETATVTIVLNANSATFGKQEGTITVSAPNQTTKNINVSGFVLDPSKLHVDFRTSGGFPKTWTNDGYTYTSWSGTIYSSEWKQLITSKLIVEEGEKLYISAKRYASSSNAEVGMNVYYKENESDSFTADKVVSFDLTGLNGSTYQFFEVSGLPAGELYLDFNGKNLYIQEIYGLKEATKTVYLNPTEIWNKDGARFALYAWKGEGSNKIEDWTNFTAVEGADGKFEATINDAYTSIILARMNGAAEVNSWNNVWNQTEDITGENFYDGAIYTITSIDGGNDGKSTYTLGGSTLVLSENDEESKVVAGAYDEVTVEFTMGAGKFAAICLPFATTTTALGEGVKAWAFTGYTDGNIDLSTTTELAAATPYIIYAANGIDGLTFQNVTIESNEAGKVEQGAIFQGSYVKMPAGTMIGKYGVTPEGMIKKAGEGASMKAFRAYFEGIKQNAKLACDGVIIGEATGIDTIENAELTGELYDLQGRRVNNAQKGIYIQNGKKFVVK